MYEATWGSLSGFQTSLILLESLDQWGVKRGRLTVEFNWRRSIHSFPLLINSKLRRLIEEVPSGGGAWTRNSQTQWINYLNVHNSLKTRWALRSTQVPLPVSVRSIRRLQTPDDCSCVSHTIFSNVEQKNRRKSSGFRCCELNHCQDISTGIFLRIYTTKWQRKHIDVQLTELNSTVMHHIDAKLFICVKHKLQNLFGISDLDVSFLISQTSRKCEICVP